MLESVHLSRVALLAALLLGGCRTPAKVELLEREIRDRDRRIHELQYRLEKQIAVETGSFTVTSVPPAPGSSVPASVAPPSAEASSPERKRRPRLRDLFDLAPEPDLETPADSTPAEARTNPGVPPAEPGPADAGPPAEASQTAPGTQTEDPLPAVPPGDDAELGEPDVTPERPGVVDPGVDPDPAAPGDSTELEAIPRGEPQATRGVLEKNNGRRTRLGRIRLPFGRTAQLQAENDLFQVLPASYAVAGDAVEGLRVLGILCEAVYGAEASIGGAGPASETGLLVVFEQLDRNGQTVISAGDVSIRVLDPAGKTARLGQLNAGPEDLLQHVEEAVTGRQFQMVVPLQHLPVGERVKVEVAFATDDGRLLKAGGSVDFVTSGNFPTRSVGAEQRLQPAATPPRPFKERLKQPEARTTSGGEGGGEDSLAATASMSDSPPLDEPGDSKRSTGEWRPVRR